MAGMLGLLEKGMFVTVQAQLSVTGMPGKQPAHRFLTSFFFFQASVALRTPSVVNLLSFVQMVYSSPA